MKKRNQMSTAILAIATVTILVACKKEINVVKPSPTTTMSLESITKKPPTSYTGSTSLGDSTTQKGL